MPKMMSEYQCIVFSNGPESSRFTVTKVILFPKSKCEGYLPFHALDEQAALSSEARSFFLTLPLRRRRPPA